jgi:hypothetical protein
MASFSSSSSSSSLSPKSLLPSEPEPWRTSTSPRLPPGHLLDIPDDLLFEIFTIYLRLEDVCGLDSALCNKRRRAEFLELVSRRVLLFNREEIDVLEPRMTTKVHNRLGAGALRWILKRGIHLASLRLYFISAAEQESICESVASLALTGCFDKLETIDLFACSYIENADLAAVLSKCYGSVKSIYIQRCGLIESSAAHIKCCTKLEAFAPNGNESAAELVAIFEACRKLRGVDLNAFEHRLTDEVLLSLAAQCPLMEHLGLAGCTSVSDAAIRTVAESCPLLQYIDLEDGNVIDATVVSLCMRCPLLTHVFLFDCANLTDAAALAVAERLPGITHILLGGIEAITSSAIETLVSKCPELIFIGVAYCPNISDATLAKIAEHCSELRKMSVHGLSDVTAAGLAEVAIKCTKLTAVRISRIDESAVAALHEKFPHVVWDIA